MHLISALIAGIRGAENGVAQLFLRDTVNRATWYEDFEGHGADSSGADIPLGSSGEAIVFVAALVDVVVKNSLGTTVREWTDGYSAACVEVISDSFTGTNYDTAAVAAGNPTNANAVLSLWNNSAGAIDWKIGTGATDLDDALVGASALLFNVKAYGALGNGVADDRGSIVSAIAAAVAAGGGEVFFPGGTYRISANLTVTAGVNLRGASPSTSVILVDFASDALGAIRTASSAAGITGNVITQLTIRPAQTFTGAMVYPRRGAVLYQCTIGDPTGAVASSLGVFCDGNTDGIVDVFETQINIVGVGSCGLDMDSASQVRVDGCYLATRTAAYTGDMARVTTNGRLLLNGTTFENLASVAVGSSAVAYVGNNNELVMTGCRLLASSSSIELISLGSDTSPALHEIGNEADNSAPLVGVGTASLTASGKMRLATREGRQATYTSAGSTVIDALNYAYHYFNYPSNAVATITFNDAPPGCPLTIVWHNNHGAGGGTITFDTTRVRMAAAANQFTVAANSIRVFRFVSALLDTNLRWVEMGAATADEPE